MEPKSKLKEAISRQYAPHQGPAPAETVLNEAADNLTGFFELLIEEDQKQRKNGGTGDH